MASSGLSPNWRASRTSTYRSFDGTEVDSISTLDVANTILHANTKDIVILARVTKLTLESFDFELCAQDFVEVLHLMPLRHLTFTGCYDTWQVLEKLANKLLKLHSFVDEGFKNPNLVAPSINNFLRSFGGLKELKRTYQPDANDDWNNCMGFAWSAIQAHASTLQILQVDDVLTYNESWIEHRSMDAFQKLCSNLVHLKQLAIRPPSADRVMWTAPNGFMSFLECLKKLQSLTALKLIIRPHSMRYWVYKPKHATDLGDSTPRLTRFEMQELADVIFSTLHVSCPRLTAFILHATGNWTASDSSERLYGHDFGYMRAARLDQYGRSHIAAHAIPKQEIKYHEPCSNIFEGFVDYF